MRNVNEKIMKYLCLPHSQLDDDRIPLPDWPGFRGAGKAMKKAMKNVDKFQNCVIKLKFNNIFITYGCTRGW